MPPRLQQIIEQVYPAFQMPPPASIEGCPHCLDRPGVDALLKKPLRELTPEDLKSYVSSALLTLGTADDYLYFLPRILEILSDQSWFEPEVVGRAIHSTGFTVWPEERRVIVLQFFEEVFVGLLKHEQSGSEIDAWLCALGRMHVDLGSYLDRIIVHGPQLIDLFEWNHEALSRDNLFSGFWDDAPKAKRQVIDWFQSPETLTAIDKAYAAKWGYPAAEN